MKTIIIFFIFSLTAYLHAQKIDSIHIVSCLEDFESVKRFSRSDFLCSMNKNPEILDTTIYNQTEIDYFLTLIQDLEFIKDLNVNTDGFEWDTVFVDTKQGIIKIPIEQNSLDNRMFLELYSNNDKEIIWISVDMIDIGFKRYRLKKELVRFLGRFTNLFVEYWP